jgi:molybdopterin-binding protein
MQLSARNVFKGKVIDAMAGPIMAKVRVDIGSGNIVTAIVTADAMSALGVNIGDEISVVIKATGVMLGK